MPDTASIVLSKTFTYRGVAEVWTNKYHFEGPTPSSAAEWLALATAIWNSERAALHTSVRLTGVSGYQAGNEAAVYMVNQAQLGAAATTGVITGTDLPPGDAAVWVRWSTNERNSKNKPKYLRKYFHGVPQGTNQDVPIAAAVTALNAHGAKMMDGSLPNGVKVSGPQGADPTATATSPFFTTRTLKRNARSPI